MPSVFDPNAQAQDPDRRITAALERLSHVFRVRLWQENRRHGLSPIQVQILVFLLFQNRSRATVGGLARELNVTAPTISDAVRMLVKKGLVQARREETDRRMLTLMLTARGRTTAREASSYADDIHEQVVRLAPDRKAALLPSLLQLLAALHGAGLVSRARMCLLCRFYDGTPEGDRAYCRLMQKPLGPLDLRVDCPEHKPAAV